MWEPDYFVRFVGLPSTVNGVTLPNSDGTFDIYINSSLPEERQTMTLRHELCHIKHDHFYSEASTRAIEDEANGRKRQDDREAREACRVVPLFESPAALADWMLSVARPRRTSVE